MAEPVCTAYEEVFTSDGWRFGTSMTCFSSSFKGEKGSLHGSQTSVMPRGTESLENRLACDGIDI